MVEDELDGNGCMSALCAQLSERFGLLEGQPGGAMPRRRIMGVLEALACMCLCASMGVSAGAAWKSVRAFSNLLFEPGQT